MEVEKQSEILAKLPEERRIFIPVLEALLFSSDSPLTPQKIREILTDFTPKDISRAVDYLNEQYRRTGRSFEIKAIMGGYQMFTLPEFESYIKILFQTRQKTRLTQKALETLAIIAYKQPITKSEIEEIRGVNVDGVMKTLLARRLTTIAGRAQAPGSPFLYKTTKEFLNYFGLNSLEDLPKLKEIDELISAREEGAAIPEKYLKAISPVELGLKINGNGSNSGEGETAHDQEDSA